LSILICRVVTKLKGFESDKKLRFRRVKIVLIIGIVKIKS